MSNIWVLITSNEKIIYAQKSREKKKKRPLPCLKQGKNSSVHIREG